MVVWRRKDDNPWLHKAETIVNGMLEEPDPYATDEPTCGPGPFSMANADTTSGILRAAGFTTIALERYDRPIFMGADIDEAVDVVMALGPAAEVIRLSGDKADAIRAELRSALRDGLREFETPDGVYAESSTWICTAENPSI